MVTVVSTPAQSQLAQVAGAYYDTANHTGIVHKHLCALSCLSVFVGGIVYILGVADVPEVEADSVLHGNFLSGDPQDFHQRQGVLVGTV